MSHQHRTITLSDESRARAEQRVRDEGFGSVEACVDALIRDDEETSLGRDWLRARIEEGLASGNAGTLTPDKLDRLIEEGIAGVSLKK